MAQERTMTMTWIVLAELCRRLPVVRLLREAASRYRPIAIVSEGLTVRLQCAHFFSMRE
jgi:hypothetical protein